MDDPDRTLTEIDPDDIEDHIVLDGELVVKKRKRV